MRSAKASYAFSRRVDRDLILEIKARASANPARTIASRNRHYPGVCFVFVIQHILFVASLGAAESDVSDSGQRAATPSTAAPKQHVDFVRDIEPILAKHCYECHAADNQESGLRLDGKARALAGGDGGVIIVPGKSAESRLIEYISGVDPDSVMPPEGELLTTEQVQLFRQWVDQGADWPVDEDGGSARAQSDHWAFQPLARPDEPDAEPANWIRNPIDAFVLANHNERGISPSPAANQHTLIRRLSLDLLGLPPTVESVDEFVNDESDDAYEELVDRLLRSPHFGERWGRHWLDKARYADSDGYEKDRPRPNAWRWRDWVIQAVNDDMPFDQFTIEQLAGDLLPDATDMQKLATAFHRQTLTNTEGGTDKEQFRVEAVFDRVETTGAIWLGLTVGCARCHSHKYDPITQREYYQLFAFLDNGDEVTTKVPISEAAVAKYETAKADYDQKVRALESQISETHTRLQATFDDWQADAAAQIRSFPSEPINYHPLDNVTVTGPEKIEFQELGDGSFLVKGDNADNATYTVTATSAAKEITGFRVEVLADPSLPQSGPGRADDGRFVLSEFRVQMADSEHAGDGRPIAFRGARAGSSDGTLTAHAAIDEDEKTGWTIGAQNGRDAAVVFVTPSPLTKTGTSQFTITLKQLHGKKQTIGRFRISVMTGPDPERIAPASLRDILLADSATRSEEQTATLFDFYVGVDPQMRQLQRQVKSLKRQPPKEPTMPVRVVAQRTEDVRTSHIMRRGDFLQPMAEVSPGTLEVLHPLDVDELDAGSERLRLARWLVSPHNPLTPRVAVNHIWSYLFGRGLVRTNNDFGVRGEAPTHPQLLDWLAGEYLRLGWSRKAMIKRIVMSSTYRQSAMHRPKVVEIDPQNNLLSRQNRFRVEAEIVRDLALAASGLLSPKIGGPSVFPPMSADVANLSYNNNFQWKTSTDDDRFRRGMYTFFKRTAPHPNLVTFDCPDSNTACIQRRSSNTPLQALTVLNNEVFFEASRALAFRVLAGEFENNAERLAAGFRLCVARPPTADELDRLSELLSASRDWFGQHTEESKQLTGESEIENVSIEEAAAWVATLRIVMNLDEFITRE